MQWRYRIRRGCSRLLQRCAKCPGNIVIALFSLRTLICRGFLSLPQRENLIEYRFPRLLHSIDRSWLNLVDTKYVNVNSFLISRLSANSWTVFPLSLSLPFPFPSLILISCLHLFARLVEHRTRYFARAETTPGTGKNFCDYRVMSRVHLLSMIVREFIRTELVQLCTSQSFHAQLVELELIEQRRSNPLARQLE